MMKGNLFIISSPSGGGKGTLIEKLLEEVPNVSYSVSYTTRQARDGEENGKDYIFVSGDEFKRLIAEDEFIEYAVVHGNFYGTSRSKIEKETSEGKDVILEIDVQGARIIREKVPDAIGVFILPPSYEVLSRRLFERNTESGETLGVRLNNAKQEVKAFEDFDYVIINDEIENASSSLQTIFLAERRTRDRQIDEIRDILRSFDIKDNG